MSEFRQLTVSEVCDKLTHASRVMILSHVNPDGDTVGSAFALKGIVEALGGSAACRCAAEPQKRLRCLYLRQESCAYEEGEEAEYDLILSVDVAAPAQLGELEYLTGKVGLMLDHHSSGDPFADNCIDPTASSAGEIVYEIYSELLLRGAITAQPDVCRRIYAAIVSDTGSFKFTNTTPQTHTYASELLEAINSDTSGVSATDLIFEMFGSRTRKEVLAQRIALENLRYIGEGDIAIVSVSAAELETNGLGDEDVGNIVDIPRGIEGVMVAVAIRQSLEDRRKFKLSCRANCDTDLAKICLDEFGGGGHKRAAGATLYADSVDEAKEVVIKAFAEKYKEYLGK